MSNHESVVKQNTQKLTPGAVKHTLKVVSGMSINDVVVAERTVHLGHTSQMSKIHSIAVENLRLETGLPVDTFVSSGVVDLARWRENKVGEYFRSPNGDTFTYTEVVEDKGSRRVETVAFTSRSRAEVISSLGEPEQPSELDRAA